MSTVVDYIIAGNIIIVTGLTNNFAFAHAGISSNVGSEATNKVPYRSAPTFSNLRCYVSANATTASTTVKIRKNVANGSGSVSIGSGATGEFTDSTHSDTLASGDTAGLQIVPGSANSITVEWVAATCNIGDIRYSNQMAASFSSASATRYFALAGGSSSVQSAEAQCQTKVRGGGTLQKGFVNVSTNSRAQATTVKSRVNTADGTISISITGSTTGVFEDTTHSDTINDGDLVNYSLTTGSGSGSVQCAAMGASYVPGAGKVYPLVSDDPAGIALSGGSTTYVYPHGKMASDSTEANMQVDVKATYLAKNVFCELSANTASSGTGSIAIRKNGSTTSVSASIAHGTTGYFEDTTDSQQFDSGDKINYLLTGATNGTMTFRHAGSHLQYDYVPPITGSGAATEGHDASSGTGKALGGTGVAVEQRDTAAGTAKETITGSGTPSERHDTAAGSGGQVAASGAPTERADTAAGSGKETFTGTGTPSERHDTASGAGLLTITGSGSPAEGHDTASGTGAAIGGTGTPTEARDTASGSGKLTISGSAAVTERRDASAGAGLLTIAGTGTPTERHDSASGSGDVASGADGSGAATERHDTAAGSGAETITGAGAVSEGHDSASGAGLLTIAGSGSATEAHDTAAGSGKLTIVSSGAAAEQRDTASGAGLLTITGSGSPTEAHDTASGSGTLTITGSGAAQGRNDSGAGSATILIDGAGTVTERADTAAGVGSSILSIHGSGAPSEQRDAAEGSGQLLIQASGSARERGDIGDGAGVILISGAGARTERRDQSQGVGWVIRAEDLLIAFRLASSGVAAYRLPGAELEGVLAPSSDVTGYRAGQSSLTTTRAIETDFAGTRKFS